MSFCAVRDTPPPATPSIIFWSPTILYTLESGQTSSRFLKPSPHVLQKAEKNMVILVHWSVKKLHVLIPETTKTQKIWEFFVFLNEFFLIRVSESG